MANEARFISISEVQGIIGNYEKIELATSPNSYFIPVDIEQITERSKKSDILKVFPNAIYEKKDDMAELASLLFMPGSDLPPLRPDEVEIARMSFNTTIGNAYSLRAEWGDEITYRMVTEMKDFKIDVPIQSSVAPLTLEEIIWQFENAGPPIGLNDLAYELNEGSENPSELDTFINAESAFYSGFRQFYIAASEVVIENRFRDEDEDGDED